MSVEKRLRSYVERLPVPPRPDVSTVVSTRRRPTTRLAPLAAAAAVLVLLALLAVPGAFTGAAQPGDGARAASIPNEVARYSYLTGDVSDSPPGRAIMAYQQGYGVEFFDFPQALVLGADDDVYRRVDLAEERGGALAQGDPAPMLLSPDGSRIAVGTYAEQGNLAVQDLTTGAIFTIATHAGWNVRPVAWSPDRRFVAALAGDPQVMYPHGPTDPVQRVVLFDLDQRREIPLAEELSASMVAFSPDGNEMALQLDGPTVQIVDWTGQTRRRLTLPPTYYLRGAGAWSPDRRLIAVHNFGSNDGGPRVAFVDADGDTAPVPGPLRFTSDVVVGWTGDDTVLVLGPEYRRDRLIEVDIGTGERRVLTGFDTGPGDNYQIGDVHLATGLIAGYRLRDAGWPERGPWPVWMRAVVGLLVLVVAWAILKPGTRRLKESGRPACSSGTTDASGTIRPTLERNHDAGR